MNKRNTIKKTEYDEINQLFIKAFNGHNNMMTPTVMERKYLGESKDSFFYYELSTGKGIVSTNMYGVTVISQCINDCEITKEHAKNECFDCIEDARQHIKQLKKVIA